ncbi:MAG: hypothetical protein KDC43_21050, partial [Saprospiraceae bacterium]|nr:hypothetical protein [Saprospiraceae bacterium]
EPFIIQDPDGNTYNLGGTPGDCGSSVNSFTVPAATWNGWATTFGGNIPFTLLGDPDVDSGVCGANNYTLTANEVLGFSLCSNDYNGAENASDLYPAGTTTVTYSTQDLNGNTLSCS